MVGAAVGTSPNGRRPLGAGLRPGLRRGPEDPRRVGGGQGAVGCGPAGGPAPPRGPARLRALAHAAGNEREPGRAVRDHPCSALVVLRNVRRVRLRPSGLRLFRRLPGRRAARSRAGPLARIRHRSAGRAEHRTRHPRDAAGGQALPAEAPVRARRRVFRADPLLQQDARPAPGRGQHHDPCPLPGPARERRPARGPPEVRQGRPPPQGLQPQAQRARHGAHVGALRIHVRGG